MLDTGKRLDIFSFWLMNLQWQPHFFVLQIQDTGQSSLFREWVVIPVKRCLNATLKNNMSIVKTDFNRINYDGNTFTE